jgi:predicted permease
MNAASRAPRLALLLLRLLLRGEAREVVTGDLLEEFDRRALCGGHRSRARRWFWRQALGSIFAVLRGKVGRRRAGAGSGETSPGSPAGPGARRPLRAAATGALQDLRFAVRALRRRPGFALLATLTLAVGVGATTSVFGYANWILLRPLPGVSAPAERLAIVEYRQSPNRGTGVSYLNLQDLEAGAPAIERLVAGTQGEDFQLSARGLGPLLIQGDAVTPGYFDVLGVRPNRGRLFTPEETRPEASEPVAVISHRLWTEAMRSDPSVIGRTLMVNGLPLTVIGVAGEGFAGHERISAIDMWVPIGMYWPLRHRPALSAADRGSRLFFETVALLAPGATPEQAEAQLREVMARLVAAYPDENEIHSEHVPVVFAGVGTRPRARAGQWQMVALMSAVALLVLLVACANNANLLFTRVVSMRGESAVRRALGASRGRLVRQQLAEALLLALAGGALAWGVAASMSRLFAGDARLGAGVSIDARVLVFALATAVTLPMLFALLPAWLSGRVDLVRNLPGGGSFSVRRRAAVRGTLTVVQLALSLALLVGSLLMIRSVAKLADVDLGFDPEGLVVAFVDPGPQGYTRERAIAFHLELLARAKEMDGVEAATVAYNGPFETNLHVRVRPGGAPAGNEWPSLPIENAGTDYFATARIPVLTGREFRPEEMVFGAPTTDGVAILNEMLARSLFGGVDVIGRTVVALDRELTVVGVVGNVRNGFREDPDPILYQPLPADALISTTMLRLIVRTERPPERVAASLRDVVAGLDPNVPVYLTQTLQRLMAQDLAEERILMRFLIALGALSTALAAVGLYAVVRWSVAERTREIGVRMALGAAPAGVVALVTRTALLFGLAGVLFGYGASVGVARLLGSTLFGVDAFDPASWTVAAALLLFVALLAAAHPAWAAARVHPSEALRHE